MEKRRIKSFWGDWLFLVVNVALAVALWIAELKSASLQSIVCVGVYVLCVLILRVFPMGLTGHNVWCIVKHGASAMVLLCLVTTLALTVTGFLGVLSMLLVFVLLGELAMLFQKDWRSIHGSSVRNEA